MMNVLAILSLAGALTGHNLPAPSWESDYSLALKLAESKQKPIALFVAAGPAGWQKLTREGGLSAPASQTLSDRYICLFIDTETAQGKRTATAFGLTDSLGLIISDRTGKLQAFRHTGQLSQAELADRLVKYADSGRPVATTETVAAPVPAPYTPTPSYGGCPNCRH